VWRGGVRWGGGGLVFCGGAVARCRRLRCVFCGRCELRWKAGWADGRASEGSWVCVWVFWWVRGAVWVEVVGRKGEWGSWVVEDMVDVLLTWCGSSMEASSAGWLVTGGWRVGGWGDGGWGGCECVFSEVMALCVGISVGDRGRWVGWLAVGMVGVLGRWKAEGEEMGVGAR